MSTDFSEYAELHARSNFSFLFGASHPEELAQHAARLKLRAIALTDRESLAGAVRFSKAAEAAGIAGICGAELALHDEALPPDEERPRIVLLAENETGYANLCEILSHAQLEGGKRNAHLPLERLQGRGAGLVALCGGPGGPVAAALRREDPASARRIAVRLGELFPGSVYLELQHHLRPEDAALAVMTVMLARKLALPIVASNGVRYARREDGPLADVVTCIRRRTTLARAGINLAANYEYYLKSAAQMARIFSPYPDALRAGLEISERCTYRLRSLRGQFPLFPIPAHFHDADAFLRALVENGALKRYNGNIAQCVRKQIEHELQMIAQMRLAGYFLIVWDIVQEAQKLGVLAQGRGSAANSIVCYCLEITAIDPIKMELLFERFLSEDRQEYPDIDIDFAHEDRERVIQRVYEKYGRHHAAMAAEVISYRTRSALRDVAKVFGVTPAQADALSHEYDALGSLDAALGLEPSAADRFEHRRDLPQPREPVAANHATPATAVAHNIAAFTRALTGFPRHLSIHVGGMVITRDPLIRVAPIESATMPGRTVLQWDKDDLQELGLIKIDLLGLGMLSLLREAFTLYARHYPGKTLSLATLPQADPATYDMLCNADSIGVFQVESRAQQAMLPRLRPRVFYDLVMQVAIIRPGPIQGDMIHPFLRRRAGLEEVVYPHPKLRPVLERTLGVPLFQEQGMRMAIEAAGFSAGEADLLRRAMGHKRSHEKMQALREKLVAGMAANGIDRGNGEQLFHMLEGFADYGFPESHAASFALLTYASAYLKCRYPAIFAAAILNVQPLGFYSPEVLVNDARRHGVVVRPVRVNASGFLSSVEPDGALRLGYHCIRGIGGKGQARLSQALLGANFRDLRDFVQRSGLAREALEALAMTAAFAPWYRSRREALWALQGIYEEQRRSRKRCRRSKRRPVCPNFRRARPRRGIYGSPALARLTRWCICARASKPKYGKSRRYNNAKTASTSWPRELLSLANGPAPRKVSYF